MADRPTYPELLKLFYRHSFPDQLGAPAAAVAHAIIYKSNDLFFPASFKMSNTELAQLSGERLANIGRTRQKVMDTCIIDGSPLFVYTSNGRHKSGSYMINFNLCSGLTSTSRQKQGKIDKDPNPTLPNPTKIPPTPQNVSTKYMISNDNEEEGGVAPLDEDQERTIVKAGHIQDLILRKWKHQLKEAPDIGSVKDALRESGGDHRPIVMAITKAATNLNTPTPSGALNLVMAIARKEGGNGGISPEQLSAREREIKEMEAGLKEALEEKDEAAVDQLGYLIEQKKKSLDRLRGGE